MKSIVRLDKYTRNLRSLLKEFIDDTSLEDKGAAYIDREYSIDIAKLIAFINDPNSHKIGQLGPKSIEVICKDFSISPSDAWKIRIDKYHEDRKDKDERKRKKERYVTVKINKIDADKLLILLQRLRIAQTHEKAHSLLDKIIIPLQQKFDWKE